MFSAETKLNLPLYSTAHQLHFTFNAAWLALRLMFNEKDWTDMNGRNERGENIIMHADVKRIMCNDNEWGCYLLTFWRGFCQIYQLADKVWYVLSVEMLSTIHLIASNCKLTASTHRSNSEKKKNVISQSELLT